MPGNMQKRIRLETEPCRKCAAAFGSCSTAMQHSRSAIDGDGLRGGFTTRCKLSQAVSPFPGQEAGFRLESSRPDKILVFGRATGCGSSPTKRFLKRWTLLC